MSLIALVAGCARQPAEESGKGASQVAVHNFPIIEDLFTAGYTHTVDGTKLTFRAVEFGKVVISSGKIIACEPFALGDVSPLEFDFPKGTFPVIGALASFTDANGVTDERIAMAKVVFSTRAAAYWKDCQYGYPVDGGLGCFVDADFQASALKGGIEDWGNRVIKEMGDRSYVVVSDPEISIAMFSTGFGDGRYFSLAGFDESGAIVALVTNFRLISLEEKE
jgi:hypothetical protein